MKRVNLLSVMNETNMSIINDENNNFVYDTEKLCMWRGDRQDKIGIVTMKMNLQASKENQEEAVSSLISLMESLNAAFNRAVSAPESMKLFKVLEKSSRYSGNNTVAVELKLATLSTGAGSAIYTLLGYTGMTMNIWGTAANVFTATYKEADETYGLGNALRSWKVVMKKYGKDFDGVAASPAVFVNYLQN
jgi:hypothetical protein